MNLNQTATLFADSYLGSFRGPALVLDIRGFGINPRKLVDKALELGEEGEYEQVWCVFDRDECDVDDFNSALGSGYILTDRHCKL